MSTLSRRSRSREGERSSPGNAKQNKTNKYKDKENDTVNTLFKTTAFAAALLAMAGAQAQQGQQQEQDTSMSFFITSEGLDGGNLGGLEGADAHCSALAEAAGVSGKTWRAYLSTSSVDARDRIGSGPWYNQKGELIANSVDDLHYVNTNLTKQKSITEKGEEVNGVGDQPNQHDILTGSNLDGTKSADTCNDWTSNSGDYFATVGHHDRIGGGPLAGSWNATHRSRGCSQENLQASGGNGYFYCFAE